MAQRNQAGSLTVDGRRIRISNRDKVLYPKTGTTKGAVIDYYLAVADRLLPHIAGRPLTRKRFPDGVDTDGFFEKNCPRYHPEWMTTTMVTTANARTEYCVVSTPAGLAWLANLAAIELHPALHLAADPEHPLAMVFDLDPGEPAGLRECVALAKRLRQLLDHAGLRAFAKLSGGKGLHLWVPVRDSDYETTRAFARAVASVLERDDPQRVIARMSKVERAGKVFIDWSQNHRNKTTVAAYSLRARDEPTVSLPVFWDELTTARRPERLRLTLEDALHRFEREDDPWQDLEAGAAPVPAAENLAPAGRRRS